MLEEDPFRLVELLRKVRRATAIRVNLLHEAPMRSDHLGPRRFAVEAEDVAGFIDEKTKNAVCQNMR